MASLCNLNPNAESLFKNLSLTPEQEPVIENYIINYSGPGDGFGNRIAWMAYRVWNATKSIFGLSDWQAAISIVKNRMIKIINDDYLDGISGDFAVDPGKPLKLYLEKETSQRTAALLTEILELQNSDADGYVAIDRHVDGQEKTPEDLGRRIQRMVKNSPQPQKIAPPKISLHRPIDQLVAQGVAPDLAQVIADTPQFNSYTILRRNLPLSSLALRPSNLFFQALGGGRAISTLPRSECLFAFDNPEGLRKQIMDADPNMIVEFTAPEDLKGIYGENTYRISYGEIQEILKSQCIYCSSMLPVPFYSGLKKAMTADGILLLPGTNENPERLNDVSNVYCSAFLTKVEENPAKYGFKTKELLDEFLNLSLYQIGAMVVKTEDFFIFTDGNAQILERPPGKDDAICLINACGIRGICATPGPMNQMIMEQTFKAVLLSADKGIVVFPAIGMDAWKGDPEIYWNAFLEAVVFYGDDLETILINPRHQKSAEGRYIDRIGDEFAEILADRLANAPDDRSRKNLFKIINLFDQKTDLLQLARNLKQAYPDKTISLVNASDPDATLGNHTAQDMNNMRQEAPATEEHYSMLGTHGLCFESITGVHEASGGMRVIQA